jgi:hypothetical protein
MVSKTAGEGIGADTVTLDDISNTIILIRNFIYFTFGYKVSKLEFELGEN